MLTRAELTELGPHERLELSFGETPPLTAAVWGPNGGGKSTVIHAVAYAFSGDTAWVSGAASIAAGEAAKPKVSVWFRPSAADTLAQLDRTAPGPGHKRAARKLTYAEKHWSADAAIADELGRWLGGPPKDWARTAVVRQGHLLDVVDAEPYVRKTALARALGLDHAAKVATLLRDEEQLVASRLADDRLIAEAGARASELFAELEAARAALEATPPVDRSALDNARARHARAVAANATQREYAANLARLRELDATRSVRAANLDALRRTAEAAATHVEAACKLESEAAAAAAYESRSAMAVEARDRYERASSGLRVDPGLPPTAPTEPEELRAARSFVGLWRQVAKLTAGAPCPTCQRTVEGTLADNVAAAQASLAAYDVLERQYGQALEGYRGVQYAYDVRRALYTTAVECRDRALREYELHVEELAKLPVPERPARDLRVQADECRRQAQAAQYAQRQIEPLAQALAAHDAERAGLAAKLDAAPPGDPADLGPATADLQALEAADDAHRRAAAAVDILAKRAAAEAEVLTAARQRASGGEARQQYRDQLTRLRAAFHPDAAPATLMAAYIADKIDAVNDWLGRLAARFRVTAGDELSFVASFADGTPGIPAERLSGGEKAVLALAWTAATAATRLLLLDEPTYGLDAARLEALCHAVAGWRSTAPDCQLVLVTHDRRLADCCETVLDLGG